MLKKIAIATLIAAPLVADFAARSLPSAADPAGTEVPAPAPPPPPTRIAAAPVKPMIASPIAPTGVPNMNGVDPVPTLDPNALAAGIPVAAAQALPRPQVQPPMPQTPGAPIAMANAPVSPPQVSGDFKPAASERISKF